MLYHMVVLFLVFEELPFCFQYWLHQFTFPSEVGSIFSTFSSKFIWRLFEDIHFDRCEVITHYGFDLHFSNNYIFWAPFHVPVSCLYVFFGKISIQVFCPFFDWVVCLFVLILSCMNCLYILDINPFLVISFASIFSHSISSLFVLSVVSLAVQNLLSLIIPFVYFCFYFFCLRRWILKK